MVLAGTARGFAFLTKMGQALLGVPGMAVAYLLAAPLGWRRRIVQLLVGGVALVATGARESTLTGRR